MLPRDQRWVSKTDVANYYRCPYAFWLMDTGVVDASDVFGWDDDYATASDDPDDVLDEVLAATSETPGRRGLSGALKAGGSGRAKVTTVDRFVRNDRTIVHAEHGFKGRPFAYEHGTFAPLLVKQHSAIQPLDRIELAFYWTLLESRRRREAPPYGWIALQGRAPLKVSLTSANLERFARLVEAVRAARTTGVDPSPCSCKVCVERDEVIALDKERLHLGLIAGIRADDKTRLVRAGVKNIPALAVADPEVLSARTATAKRKPIKVERIRRFQCHARAWHENVPVRMTEERFSANDFIAIDLEFTESGRGKYDGAWLIGVLVRKGGRTTIRQTLCEKKSDLKAALSHLAATLDANPTLPLVTFNGTSSDVRHLRLAAKRHRVHLMPLIEERHVDLYLLAARSVRLPLRSIGLKSFAGYLGYRRRSGIASGSFAPKIYETFRLTKDERERRRLRRDLLAYNREDLEALVIVADFLRTT